MVPADQVSLTEDGSTCQPCGEVLKVLQRIQVSDQAEIESPVVSIWPPLAIGLSHHMQGRGLLTLGGAGCK